MYVCIYIQTEKTNNGKSFFKNKQIRLKLMVNIYVINQNESWLFVLFICVH
jgi:hypothetical protein